MPYALIARPLAFALGISLLSTAAFAGGYGGGSSACSPIAPQEAHTFLSYADSYSDGDFQVRHTEQAGAQVYTNSHGEGGYGYGSSDTQIQSAHGVVSWKRSIQRSNASAQDGSASAGGFSASFVKARTGDGKYYMFKGMASTGASAGPGGTSTSQYGLAKSAAGRY